MKRFKRSGKIITAFILGLILASTGVYAVTSITGSNVTYSNTKSGLSSTDVQGAIDELYEKSDIRKLENFVAAYTYSESGINKCITGKESTCKRTTCYKNKTTGSCPSGTIILYKVNNNTIVPFHVMFDEGKTMTIQTVEKIIAYRWMDLQDFIGAGGKAEDFGVDPEYNYVGNNTLGPRTIVRLLDKATLGWNNINNQTYTLGTTSFSNKGVYTGCDMTTLECTKNQYTLPERTSKSRIITVQEAKALGCSKEENSCPKWLLTGMEDNGVWTLSTEQNNTRHSFYIHKEGRLTIHYVVLQYGVKAVVEVSK